MMVAGGSHSPLRLLLVATLVACAAAELRRELTTRTWNAIGFHENVEHSPAEDQIIIGVIDSGIWPESQSFRDEGLGPPPKKWKGVCHVGQSTTFKCNNKIIGARFYLPLAPFILPPNEEQSPRDNDSHGTHVASTIAGMPVKGVSVQGLGLGTARGAVPRARIAVYKVCWEQAGCSGDLTKAVNDAIMDGVDIVSASIGSVLSSPRHYIEDTWPAANFNAMKHGVLVSLTAGNQGPDLYRVGNSEPWVMTVANSAGSGTDYETYVNLGDGMRFPGAGANPHDTGKTMMPLALGSDVELPGNNETAVRGVMICSPEAIDPKLAQGKIILCEAAVVWESFDNVGCAGLLVRSLKPDDMFDSERGRYMSEQRKVPVVVLSQQDFEHLLAYYRNATSAGGVATASIEKSVDAPDSKPRAATSSSRGPSKADINILKPDISAPGVNVIAALRGDSGPAYDMRTGTSMSCPHASGVAAYVKSFHPDWSPASIKSAMMTTATPMVPSASNKVYELAYGAGQINPLGALDPGLVYDLQEIDYIKYLCQWSNFNQSAILALSGVRDWECSKLPLEKGWTLNYPSFSIPGVPDQPFVSVFHRTLTNVGNPPTSNYKAIVNAPAGLEIIVEPTVLAFTQNLEKLSYTITIKGLIKEGGDVLSASLVWTDGRHSVRSPIIAFERPKDIEAIYEEQLQQLHERSQEANTSLTMEEK